MKIRIILAVLILAVAGASIAGYMYNKPAAKTMSGSADFTLSATDLFAEFEQNEESANAKYLNKILAVTGTITGLTASETGAITIALDAGHPMFGVTCEIAEPNANSTLKEGKTVTVKGLCTGMLMDVVLVKCSLENE